MITCNYINDYLEYYKSNKYEFNKDRILLMENIVLPTLARTDIFFDEEMYKKCITFCENNYYKLFPYQKFIYAFVFMYETDDIPLFSTFLIMMGRGNGKDGLFMPLMNFLLTPLHGIRNYNIDIIANNEGQAKDTFNVVYDMLESNQKKFKSKFYMSKEMISNYSTKSILRYNTSNAKTKDGKRGGALLFNELHAYETNDQLNVFQSQLGKIKHPRTFIITTNGYVRGGPLDERLELARDILQTGINEIRTFPFICCIDNMDEIDNPDTWIKANPSLPYLPILKNQILLDYKEMQRLPSKRPEFITKRMNLPEAKQENAVATWNDVLRCSYDDIKLKIQRTTPDCKGKNAIIGIDYADVRDFASAGVLVKVGDEYIFRQKTWICKNSPHFNEIRFAEYFKLTGQVEFQDYEIVDTRSIPIENIIEWCIEQMSQYNILKIVMDTYRYSIFKEKFQEYGISIEDRNNPYGLVRLIRRSNSVYALLAPVIEKLFTDGLINFGPSAIMRWYTNNTGTVVDKLGNTNFIKIEPKLRKNDGFSAFVHAMQARDELEEIVVYI